MKANDTNAHLIISSEKDINDPNLLNNMRVLLLKNKNPRKTVLHYTKENETRKK